MIRWRLVRLLARRESLDALRQKQVWRLMVMASITIVPVALLLPGVLAARETARLKARNFTVAVQGPVDNPVVESLRKDGFHVVRSTDATASVVHRRASVGLVLPSDIARVLEMGDSVDVQIPAFLRDDRSALAFLSLEQSLQEYAKREVSRRLSVLGVPPQRAKPLVLRPVNLERSAAGARHRLSKALPPFLLLQLLLALSLSAGLFTSEKDHRTYDALLAQPVTAAEITFSKWLGGMVMAGALMVAFLIPLAVITNLPAKLLRQDVHMQPQLLAIVGLAGVLIAMIVAAAGCLIGAFARSQQESGAYLAVAMVPAGLLALSTSVLGPGATNLRLIAVPLLGPALVVRNGLVGSISLVEIGTAVLVSVVCAAALLAVASRHVYNPRSVLRADV